MIKRRRLISFAAAFAELFALHARSTTVPEWMLAEPSSGADALRRVASLRAEAIAAMAQGNVEAAASACGLTLDAGEAIIRAARRRTTEPEMRALLAYLNVDADLIYTLAAQNPGNQAIAKLGLRCASARKGRATRETLNAITFWGRLAEQQHPDLHHELLLARRQFTQLVATQAGGSQLEDAAHAVVIAQQRLIKVAAFNQQFSMAFPDDILVDLGLDSLLLNMNFGRSLVVYVRYDHQQKADAPIPSYISFVIHDGIPITVTPLGRAAEIDAVAATFTQAAADKDSHPSNAAKALHALILAPLMGAFSYKDVDYSKSLVISPDGVLFRTPFAALEDPTGKLVADSFGLSLVDAPLEASGLGSANRTNSALSSRLLAFANPTPPRDAISRGATFLLDADKEVERIAALWPPGAADVFSHDKATPDRLFAMAKDAGILHIASHAELAYNPATLTQNPAELDPLSQTKFAPNMTDASLARSMLVFAPDRDGGGYISALEAAGLDLSHAQLAVLSACDTGGVDWEKGEGVYGLRRAFLSAGAEAVVSTLWQVDDAVTRELMVTYYRLLFQREGREQALQHATTITRQRHQHPYYWAGFVFAGNARALALSDLSR